MYYEEYKWMEAMTWDRQYSQLRQKERARQLRHKNKKVRNKIPNTARETNWEDTKKALNRKVFEQTRQEIKKRTLNPETAMSRKTQMHTWYIEPFKHLSWCFCYSVEFSLRIRLLAPSFDPYSTSNSKGEELFLHFFLHLLRRRGMISQCQPKPFYRQPR